MCRLLNDQPSRVVESQRLRKFTVGVNSLLTDQTKKVTLLTYVSNILFFNPLSPYIIFYWFPYWALCLLVLYLPVGSVTLCQLEFVEWLIIIYAADSLHRLLGLSKLLAKVVLVAFHHIVCFNI